MNAAPVPAAGSNPFDPRAVLAVVLLGALLFVALLWAIGSGAGGRQTNDGQAHAGSKGVTGYAALAGMLERQGYPVERLRTDPESAAGLLVLTPPLYTDTKELQRIVTAHRRKGPTLLVLPKWQAMPTGLLQQGAKEGWVQIFGAASPEWGGKLDGLPLKLDLAQDKSPPENWSGLAMAGALPDGRVQADRSEVLVPLVRGSRGGVLAGFVNDNGFYPELADAAGYSASDDDNTDRSLHPLIVVVEPDLLDNWGMADQSRALLAARLVSLAQEGRPGPVSFDLTLNGFRRSPNLLSLAFRPPFLAATLCLLVAALVAGWRAFRRFGPPLVEGRAIAFGKRALVANAAGLIRRSGRLHLLAAPYAALLRERLSRTLGLPRHADAAMTEAAIDRALAARDPQARPFSDCCAELRAARGAHDLLRAGQALHAIERTLTR